MRTATEERFALATDHELDIVPPTEEKFTLAYPITSFGPHQGVWNNRLSSPRGNSTSRPALHHSHSSVALIKGKLALSLSLMSILG